MRAAWILGVTALCACDGPSPVPAMLSADRRTSLAASLEAGTDRAATVTALRAALPTLAPFDAVFCHDDSMAAAVREVFAGQDDAPRILTICNGDAETVRAVKRGERMAALIEPTLGEQAIDATLLAILGDAAPQRDFVVGATVLTPASAEFGGEPTALRDDAALTTWLDQLTERLRSPDDANIRRVGVSIAAGTPAWRARLLADIERRVADYSVRLELRVRDAERRPESQVRHLTDFEEERVDGILIVPGAEGIVAQAVERFPGKPVVVLGAAIPDVEYTCSLHTPTDELARTIARLCQDEWPDGVGMLELRGAREDARADTLHDAFVDELGLRANPSHGK